MNEILFCLQLSLSLSLLLFAARRGLESLHNLVIIFLTFTSVVGFEEVVIFGLHASCADSLVVAHVLCLDLIRDRYGLAAALTTLRSVISTISCWGILTFLHTLFIAVPGDSYVDIYNALFHVISQPFVASIATAFCVDTLDVFLFGLASLRYPYMSFGMRVVVITPVCMLLDTLMFTVVGIGDAQWFIWRNAATGYGIKIMGLLGFSVFLSYIRSQMPPLSYQENIFNIEQIPVSTSSPRPLESWLIRRSS